MKQFGYINGQRVQLDDDMIEIVLERPQDDKLLSGWGGRTLARVLVYEGGKRVVGFFSVRASGDSRAGSQYGVHLGLTVTKQRSDTAREVHARPWYVEE
jgi:hypothetical protein